MFFCVMMRALTKNSKKQIGVGKGLVISLFVILTQSVMVLMKFFLIKSH
jgi:hypothetical protein